MIMAALKEEEDKDIQLEISRSRLNKSVEIPNKTVDHVEDKFIILLKSYGVIEPDNYNFSNEIWEQSIRENHNNLKASFIVRTAQELHQKSVYNKKNEEKNKKIEDVINANKKWYEENHRNFNSTISGTTAGAYVMKGTSIVLFKNEKFIEELTPFLR
jgi:hypothetical protein